MSRRVCRNLAPAQVEEPHHEQRGQHVDEPVHLAELAAQQLEQGVGGEAEGQAVGDAEGQRDRHHGEEGREPRFRGRPSRSRPPPPSSGCPPRSAPARWPRPESRPPAGATNSASDEQQSGHDGGHAGAAAGRHPGRAFDVADHGGGAGQRADHGGRGVRESRMRFTRGMRRAWSNRLAFFPTATSVPMLSNRSMKRKTKTISRKPSRSVEAMSSWNGGGGEVAPGCRLRRPFHDAGGQADGGGGQDADQHGGAHPPGQQRGDDQQAEDRQRRGVAQVAQRHGGGGVGHDMPELRKPDEGDEQPHAGGHRGVQLERDGGENQLAHAQAA